MSFWGVDRKDEGYFLGPSLFIAVLATYCIHRYFKYMNTLTKEQQYVEHATKTEEQRVINEAESLTLSARKNYNKSAQLALELSESLDDASSWLDEAEEEFTANAFGPYWDAVEEAALCLGDFNQIAIKIAQNADKYYQTLAGAQHTFPAFPVQLQTIPDASPTIKRLLQVVRMGQTNFQFANIWEHRKTRKVMVAGFGTLNEAINNIGDTIEYSVSSLRRSFSSEVAQLVQEQLKTRESIDSTGRSLDKRALEQNRMLDNIQHHRQPKRRDTPSKH
jgi:hypothetical protein